MSNNKQGKQKVKVEEVNVKNPKETSEHQMMVDSNNRHDKTKKNTKQEEQDNQNPKQMKGQQETTQ